MSTSISTNANTCRRCGEASAAFHVGPLLGLCRVCIENDHIGTTAALEVTTRERDEARRELEEVKAERDHWKSVQAFRWQQLTEIVGPLGEHDNSPYDTAARKLARLAAAERVVDGLREVHAIMDDRNVIGRTDDEMIAHNQELQAKWTELHALLTAYDTAKSGEGE